MTQTPVDEAKRRLKVEQAVRDFLHVLDQHELSVEEGLVAWNMLGFTIFQDMYPDEPYDQTQQRMMEFSQGFFESSQKSSN